MRNIIKKAFALVLATLMLAFSLTAFAEGENYIVDEEMLIAVGDNECELNSEYEYTVFTFAPDEIGKYTVTIDNGAIAIVSYNGMWVTVEPSEETVTESTFTWDCTGVGQSIWIAVISEQSTVTLAVEWAEIIIETILETTYTNKTTPEAFTLSGNKASLQYVDTFDDVENSAVLGEDGFYHLDSEEGPILYAKLNDSMLSLADAVQYGRVVALIYDENGKAIEKIDYNEAFNEYLLCSDDGVYPLTEDIITIYKEMGRTNEWYGEDGWIGGAEADAWMFACYYLSDSNGLGDVNSDGAIDQYDYILVKRHYFETRYLTEEEMALADVNADGEVDQFDYILIARHYFGTYVIG